MIKMNYDHDENINCCRLLVPHCGILAHEALLFHLFERRIETREAKGGAKSGFLLKKNRKTFGCLQ